MCSTELDRERLIGTVHGVGRARVAMFVILGAMLAGAGGQLGWWPLAALIIAAALSIFLYRNVGKRGRPEYWAAAGWLATQVPLGIGIAITGGPRSPALSWLAIAVVSLVARFNRITIRFGMAFVYILLLADTFGVRPDWTFTHPAGTLAVGGLMFSVWVFAEALMRSDLDQRSHDKVTGLPNQVKFLDDLRHALARREQRGGAIGVVAIDLDGFALAHESLGPRAGDALLSQAGARTARAAGAAELVAKSSTNDFLILLSDLKRHPASASGPGRDPEQMAREIVDAVKAAFVESFNVEGQEVYLSPRAGIALLSDEEPASDHEETAERLLSGAEFALASARSAGPGSVALYDRSRPSSERRLSVIARLRKAIEHDELYLHYQPTVDVHTGAIKGVEALARWEDAKLGMVAPVEFIAVAEETGLIDPLGTWVIEQVARQAREWDREEIRFEIAFNLSPRQLWQPELLSRMRAILAASGVPLERFVVEITESSALRDFEKTIALLGELRAEGYRIAIDDFGVELSSLSRLLEIPSDVLKIDRSFVAALSRKPNAGVMVKTIIQLAERLGMRSHAEGVETEAERRFLLTHGCELAQGYLFSRPVPASTIRERYLGSLYPSTVRLPSGPPRAA